MIPSCRRASRMLNVSDEEGTGARTLWTLPGFGTDEETIGCILAARRGVILSLNLVAFDHRVLFHSVIIFRSINSEVG